MGRRSLPLVIALSGCAPDLPREIRIESHFTAAESSLVTSAIDDANSQLGIPLLGHPILLDAGSYTDPNGFDYDDLGDDLGVVYPLDPTSPEYTWLASTNERDYEGYATLADVLIAYRLPPDAPDASRRHFHQIALHELGHYLGLPHDTDRNSIMYSGPGRLDLDAYTPADQSTFCLVYGC